MEPLKNEKLLTIAKVLFMLGYEKNTGDV